MTDQYRHPDFVLTFIPIVLFIAHTVGRIVDARLVAITIGVGLCYLVMVDGLLWHAPTD